MNGGGLHHVQLRRRARRGLEPYPARTAGKRLLDQVMFVVAFSTPLILLPQVAQVFTEQSVEGLSLFTWVALTVVNALWVVYGFVHKAQPVLVANILIGILNLAIVIGILKYS